MRAADFFEILQDTSVELEHVGVTLHGHERSRLFATDAAGTEHHDGLRFEFSGKLLHRRGKIPEVPDSRHDCAPERTHTHFIIITGVEQSHRTTFVQPLLELLRRNFLGRSPGRIDAFDAERDDLLLDLHEHALERLIGTRTLLGRNIRETGDGADDLQHRSQLRARAGQEEIDTFGGQQDRTLEPLDLGDLLQARPQVFQTVQRSELIAGEIDDLGGHCEIRLLISPRR